MEYQASTIPSHVLPSPSTISAARSKIHTTLPTQPLGTTATTSHLHNDLVPGLSASSRSSRYYGFVTGGVTPAALAADNVVSEHDQNVAVHLPDDSIATDVDYHALNMLSELLGFQPSDWGHKIFTTGATASNVLGLAIAREHVIAEKAKRERRGEVSVAKLGIVKAMRVAEVEDVQIITSAPHSSLRKAAAVLGMGHDSVVDVGYDGAGHVMDIKKLREALQKPGVVSIIAVSCAEVNTGLFATEGLRDMQAIRKLAHFHGAWLHVDAAFGLMARLLPDTEEFARVRRGVEGLELADSIAGDAHKLVNVPYDAGFFFSKRLDLAATVFGNPGAPYLATSAVSIPTPLNIGLENSRRFRALPVYANLVAYGRAGFEDMIVRQVGFSRKIATYLQQSDDYELLPADLPPHVGGSLENTYIIVIFRAKDSTINDSLIKRINQQRTIYCSGTSWEGRPAVRFAVSNWQVDEERDWPVVMEALEQAVAAQA